MLQAQLSQFHKIPDKGNIYFENQFEISAQDE